MFKEFEKIKKSDDLDALNRNSTFELFENYLVFYNGIILAKVKTDAYFMVLYTIKIGQPMFFKCNKLSYYIIDTSGLAYILDEKLNIKKKEPNTSLIITENLVIKYEYDFVKMFPKHGLFNLEKQAFIWNNAEYDNFVFIEETLFSNTNLCLHKINKDTGIPLWHFPLSGIGRFYNDFDRKWQDGEIWHFVGVVDGILWVDVMAHTLIGIDAITGELKYNLKEALPMNVFPTRYLPLIPYYGTSIYEKDLNKIWGIYASSYWEVDLNETTPQIKTWYLGEELEKYNATFPNLPSFNATHIFFGVGSLAFVPQVCALNRQTFKIDWRYDFSQEAEDTKIAFSPTKIEVTENNLFVLDNQGTLHIFERENE